MSHSSPAEGRLNRLATESSPYLRQHATNPVDWYPWGPEALAAARDQNKPIFLSIGYSACHWCHVMEEESFANPAIAAVMNEHFINIKVDREERPDLDQIYMQAVMLLNDGQGGWPMSVFLTPEQRPFFGGTYFPPRDGFGRPGFPSLLKAVADAFNRRRDDVEESSRDIANHLREAASLQDTEGGEAPGDNALHYAIAAYDARFDRKHGGPMGRPKFPPAMTMMLLLRAGQRLREPRALEMVQFTLSRMAASGLYDQLGGGFHRYSVDERWAVPHFEKMLYDNALLIRAYAEAHAASGNADFKRIAGEIHAYVAREMTDPAGGFYSTQDADSEGEEGKFFVWDRAEVEAVVGADDAPFACRAFGVTAEGNFEHGKTVLHRPTDIEVLAKEFDISVDEAAARLATVRARLLAAREGRIKPHRDEKILSAWNGLMISGLVAAGRIGGLGAAPVELARAAADFVLANMLDADGRLFAVHGNGRAKLQGYLDCHAFMGRALLDLAAATGEMRYFRKAEQLAGIIRDRFTDGSGGFHFTADDHEPLLIRSQDPMDNAIPSGNSVAASLFLELFEWTGMLGWQEAGRRILETFGTLAARHPGAFPQMLSAAHYNLSRKTVVVVVGNDAAADALELAALRCGFDSSRTVIRTRTGEASPAILAGKGLVDGGSAAYVCRDFVCLRPTTSPDALAATLTEP